MMLTFIRATYRVRGDVIDVYPAESEKEAVRIELFDDEIENLSYFDPLTGEIITDVFLALRFILKPIMSHRVNNY